jgi:predicted transcriptional regulator
VYLKCDDSHQKILINELKQLPKTWALTPVRKKQPYRKNWQSELLRHEQLEDEIRLKNATGYGLKTGEMSGGLVALDVDGKAGEQFLAQLLGDSELPPTVSWTSGKENRRQYLFKIPSEHWLGLKNRHTFWGINDENLDIRWNKHQSVLPPSAHPETEGYRWIVSPYEGVGVAIAPDWLIKALHNPNKLELPRRQTKAVKKRGIPSDSQQNKILKDLDRFLSFVEPPAARTKPSKPFQYWHLYFLLQPDLLPLTILAQINLVRVHASLISATNGANGSKTSWISLWYLLRALDFNGRGELKISLDAIADILGASESTIYQWLREGRRNGAFRYYKKMRDGGEMRIFLGSLKKLALKLDLDNWGATAEVPLLALQHLRPLATLIATQALQEKSIFAAKRTMTPQEWNFYKIPALKEILLEPEKSSHTGDGAIPFLVHVGAKRLFVGRGFVPVGTKQETIAEAIGRCDRTVRRHQKILGVPKRQICQSKPTYLAARIGLNWQQKNFYGGDPDTCYTMLSEEDLILYEKNGLTKAQREGGHPVTRSRFFSYWGQTWLYRCNFYGANQSLTTMSASKADYSELLDQQRKVQFKSWWQASTDKPDLSINFSFASGGSDR